MWLFAPWTDFYCRAEDEEGGVAMLASKMADIVCEETCFLHLLRDAIRALIVVRRANG